MDYSQQLWRARSVQAYLITDGVPHSEKLEQLLVEQSCQVVALNSAQQALDLLVRREPDLIMLDNATPGSGSVGVIHHLRESEAISSAVPILAIGREGLTEPECLTLLRSGVWDVMLQPWNGVSFSARLSNFLSARRVFLDARDNSLIDGATGLYSRKGLDTRAIELAGQCARQGVLMSCVAFTIAGSSTEAKGLKLKLDQLADIGDELRRVGRASDTIGRSNDGQFVVLAPGANGGSARLLANRLTRSITGLLNARGVDCDAPWVGRVLQPSRNGERLGEELLSDTIFALQEITAEHEIPASS